MGIVMNITNALQTGLIGLNRGIDNNPRAAGDFHGSGSAPVPETASGTDLDNAVDETTLDPVTDAATTKVVTNATEINASVALGANVDVVV